MPRGGLPTETYIASDGARRRAHKHYVDVVAGFSASGDLEPLAVRWRDGRTFIVDEVVERTPFCPGHQGGRTSCTYRVRVAGRSTALHLERTPAPPESDERELLRWWVYAFDHEPPAALRRTGTSTGGDTGTHAGTAKGGPEVRRV